MNNKSMRSLFLLTLTFLMTAFLATGCSSSSNQGDKFIMGGTYRLTENETINGDLSIFGGAVSLEKGSIINGNVILIGGTVNAAGTINGGINGLGGSITLGDSAIVYGDITTVGASVNKSDSAIVQGKVTSQSEGGLELPDVPKIIQPAVVRPFGDAMGALTRSLVVALLAVMVVLFLPRQTKNISSSIEDSPLSGGAIGLLTWILAPFVILLLLITLILIPIALIAAVIFAFGILFGWIAIGTLLGERLADLFKAQWAPAVNAGVGTFALSLGAALFEAIPCVGWIVPFIIILVATGGIVMSAFGTRTIKKSSSGPSVTVINPGPGPASPPPSSVNSVVDTTFVEPVEAKPVDEVVPPVPEKRSVLKNRKTQTDNESGQEEK
jgi:hypothetical protein